jgi:hypothetical protein
MPACARQRRHAADVDEPQGGQVHDDPRLAVSRRDQRGRHGRRVHQVKLAAHGDQDVVEAVADSQNGAEHRHAFHQGWQAGGLDLSAFPSLNGILR